MKNKQWIHKVTKNRSMPSDFDRISNLQATLSELGYNSLRGQVLHHPTFIARGRHPDLILKIKGETIPIELDGPIHGSGDDVSESEQTRNRNDDYIRSGYLPIIINEEWLKQSGIKLKDYLHSILFNLEQIIRAKHRII